LLHGADDAPHDHDHGLAAHGHSHGQAQDHSHGHSHHDHHDHHGAAAAHTDHPIATADGGHDLNLRAAYVHVLADALTSVLAILALAAALWLGWQWLDPLVGVLGAVVIGAWSVGLLRQTAAVLLDREMDHPLVEQIRTAIESDGDARVADLHLWRVGRQQYAAIASIVADAPLPSADYRARLAIHPALVHLSLEVNRCPGAVQAPAFNASH
ncbi:MAG: cation diffusion facilitator family transporter, partial [Burkholderiaceae bacterium]|nr:cation diffusion facilitator family transporter [Burkholderiaceae bacterium]